jgi:hypothetical protein
MNQDTDNDPLIMKKLEEEEDVDYDKAEVMSDNNTTTDDEDTSSSSVSGERGDQPSPCLPLFFYRRVSDSSTSNGRKRRTCVKWLHYDLSLHPMPNITTTNSAAEESSAFAAAAAAVASGANPHHHPVAVYHPSYFTSQSLCILISGYDDGSIELTYEGSLIGTLRITPATDAPTSANPIVDVDGGAASNSSVVAAVDGNGNVMVWKLSFTITFPKPQQHDNEASHHHRRTSSASVGAASSASGNAGGGGGGGFFSQFWFAKKQPNLHESSAVTTTPSAAAETTAPTGSEQMNQQDYWLPTLSMSEAHKIIEYNTMALEPQSLQQQQQQQQSPSSPMMMKSSSTSKPTCLSLDPTSPMTRFVIGFENGRVVVISKQMASWMNVLTRILPYQGPPIQHPDWRGIETITWHHHSTHSSSSYIVFADCSGIKLYDTEHWKPIAHVDRPAGASPSLYQPILPPMMVHNIRPSFFFVQKTSNNPTNAISSSSTTTLMNTSSNDDDQEDDLIVAWGDCLMNLHILRRTAAASSVSKPPPRMVVTCTMAWSLDGIVAQGVVALDTEHVAVLGIVLDDDDDEGEVDKTNNNDKPSKQTPCSLELQVIAKGNGQILQADLLEHPFSKEEPLTGEEDPYPLMNAFLVSSTANSNSRWNLAAATYHDSGNINNSKQPPCLLGTINNTTFDPESDTISVDSDDYDFLSRPTMTPTQHDAIPDGNDENIQRSQEEHDDDAVIVAESPVLWVLAGTADAIRVRVRNVDDAVQFALSQHRPALALRWALSRCRQLHRHSLSDLVDGYFCALLRLQPDSDYKNNGDDIQKKKDAKEKALETGSDEPKPPQHLSLRRMQLAAQAMPILLGGDVEMWKAWITRLEQIPGALFVVRTYIPVRGECMQK